MTKRRMIAAISGIMLVLVLSQGLPAGEDEGGRDNDRQALSLKKNEGKSFYTKANIFYEKPKKIPSTNYHKGKIFPVGSKVTVTFARGREIEFKDEKGAKYILILKRKHASRDMRLRDYFNQYFSEENPLRQGGPYDKFTETEKWNIKNGTIEKGMCRAAVLMAYGYPPSHATPDLTDDKWAYWIRSLHGRPVYVYFKDDRVHRIVSSRRLSSE